MPRTQRQRPITYRDHERRVRYVSEVAKLRVVSTSIDGPTVALVIRFEREYSAERAPMPCADPSWAPLRGMPAFERLIASTH